MAENLLKKIDDCIKEAKEAEKRLRSIWTLVIGADLTKNEIDEIKIRVNNIDLPIKNFNKPFATELEENVKAFSPKQ